MKIIDLNGCWRMREVGAVECWDGLDTLAEISINGMSVAKTKNGTGNMSLR
jgi:hypothetical protein